ncbi:MAG: hypothetical protein HYW50_03500, partial [Candidatus Diapherotrites archaeon]|nr:hypothetical protein [Candidatus Diapherotrites archaeon]
KEYQQEKTSYEPQNISTQQPVQAQLSSEETEQVRQLVEILIFDKQNYSSEQVYKVILEKGYSDGVAKEAVKQIYGETPSF